MESAQEARTARLGVKHKCIAENVELKTMLRDLLRLTPTPSTIPTAPPALSLRQRMRAYFRNLISPQEKQP